MAQDQAKLDMGVLAHAASERPLAAASCILALVLALALAQRICHVQLPMLPSGISIVSKSCKKSKSSDFLVITLVRG